MLILAICGLVLIVLAWKLGYEDGRLDLEIELTNQRRLDGAKQRKE